MSVCSRTFPPFHPPQDAVSCALRRPTPQINMSTRSFSKNHRPVCVSPFILTSILSFAIFICVCVDFSAGSLASPELSLFPYGGNLLFPPSSSQLPPLALISAEEALKSLKKSWLLGGSFFSRISPRVETEEHTHRGQAQSNDWKEEEQHTAFPYARLTIVDSPKTSSSSSISAKEVVAHPSKREKPPTTTLFKPVNRDTSSSCSSTSSSASSSCCSASSSSRFSPFSRFTSPSSPRHPPPKSSQTSRIPSSWSKKVVNSFFSHRSVPETPSPEQHPQTLSVDKRTPAHRHTLKPLKWPKSTALSLILKVLKRQVPHSAVLVATMILFHAHPSLLKDPDGLATLGEAWNRSARFWLRQLIVLPFYTHCYIVAVNELLLGLRYLADDAFLQRFLLQQPGDKQGGVRVSGGLGGLEAASDVEGGKEEVYDGLATRTRSSGVAKVPAMAWIHSILVVSQVLPLIPLQLLLGSANWGTIGKFVDTDTGKAIGTLICLLLATSIISTSQNMTLGGFFKLMNAELLVPELILGSSGSVRTPSPEDQNLLSSVFPKKLSTLKKAVGILTSKPLEGAANISHVLSGFAEKTAENIFPSPLHLWMNLYLWAVAFFSGSKGAVLSASMHSVYSLLNTLFTTKPTEQLLKKLQEESD